MIRIIYIYISIYILLHQSACWILVPQSEIKPVPPTLGTCILTTGPPGIVLLNHSSGSDMEDKLE